MSDPYARYTRLKFDRPHPKVLRITMENGRMNTADEAMHAELAEIWHDIDRDDTVNVAIFAGAGKVFSAGGDFNMIKSATEDFNARARAMERGARNGLRRHQLQQAGGERDARRRGRSRAGLRHPRRRVDRHQGLPDHRRAHAAGGRRGRPRGDRLASALRHGQGEILSAHLRSDSGRGSRAYRLDNVSPSTTISSRRNRSRSRPSWPRARRARSAGPKTRSTIGCA